MRELGHGRRLGTARRRVLNERARSESGKSSWAVITGPCAVMSSSSGELGLGGRSGRSGTGGGRAGQAGRGSSSYSKKGLGLGVGRRERMSKSSRGLGGV